MKRLIIFGNIFVQCLIVGWLTYNVPQDEYTVIFRYLAGIVFVIGWTIITLLVTAFLDSGESKSSAKKYLLQSIGISVLFWPAVGLFTFFFGGALEDRWHEMKRKKEVENLNWLCLYDFRGRG